MKRKVLRQASLFALVSLVGCGSSHDHDANAVIDQLGSNLREHQKAEASVREYQRSRAVDQRPDRGASKVSLLGGLLYSDTVAWTDDKKHTGTAKGHVFFENPDARDTEVGRAFAHEAVFDQDGSTLVLTGFPSIERGSLIIEATQRSTIISITRSTVDVRGPSRSFTRHR